MIIRPTLFSGPFLDRRAELRDDPGWIPAAREDPATLYVLGAGSRQLIRGGELFEIAFLTSRDPLVATAHDTDLTLLGWFRGARCVLVERSESGMPQLPAGTELRELRPLAPQMPEDSASLLAYARALALWKSRHRFCGVCGSPNLAARAGHVMRCSRETCGTETFPRLDPAIIVLVTDPSGERALLGRQAAWPAGRYSTIAGFVEPAESLEDAVAREVAEETGVAVGEVAYQSSQPWPFPSSLMLGFRAVARTEEITLRDGELEDARWFTRADIAAGHPALPPAGAISARLIDAWFNRPGDPPQRRERSMCLLVLAWRRHARYRLVIAANRDEFHARPAAALAPWEDLAGVVGGRDLQAAGGWFAVDRHRRCGIVTNFREFGRRRRAAPSRGGLIPAYLAQHRPPGEHLRGVEVDAPGYAGFNLLLADRESLWYASNRADQFARELPAGIYGLSNEFLDTPWPKLTRVRGRLTQLLEDSASASSPVLAAGLFDALADRAEASLEALPASRLSPEWARKLSAPFVSDPVYGTRCSTVLTVTHDNELRIAERRFDAQGNPAGESEHVLNAAES